MNFQSANYGKKGVNSQLLDKSNYHAVYFINPEYPNDALYLHVDFVGFLSLSCDKSSFDGLHPQINNTLY